MFLKNFFFIKKIPTKHGFFTRLNGLSKKKFKSLNCSSSNEDDKNKFVCNLHSGWKGSLNNISQKAIKLFDKYQIKRKNLTAIVGPCLGVKNYEVDKNFQKRFIEKNIKYSKFFRYKNKKKSYFNLRALINYQLSELGLKKIYNITRDTYSSESLFFSHRRSTHKGEKTTGRLINLISLS